VFNREVGFEMADDRVPTFVKGFDEHLEGGFPRGNVVLIGGTPGTMKSTLSFYILFQNVVHNGIKGVYLSFEQNESSIKAQAKKLGMDFAKTDDRLNIIDLASVRLALAKSGKDDKDWGEVIEKVILQSKEKLGMELLVVDSLNALELLLGRDIPRSEMFVFFEWLRSLGITVLVVAEMSPDSNKYSQGDESFLADGIIHLKLAEVSDVDVQRRIRCVKMRGSKHHPGFFNLLIEDDRFEVTRAIDH
jgi:KaiC/GvpD/RAD55 family RecA-like ATPase